MERGRQLSDNRSRCYATMLRPGMGRMKELYSNGEAA